MSRTLVLRLASILVGLAVPLLLLEAGFQLLPVTSGPWVDLVTAEQPVARFQPDTSFTWSMFATMEHARHGRTNNAGFIAPIDYVPAAHRAPDAPPVIAVVGDSFVEALMVPLEDSFVSRLRARVGHRGNVYGFGISGAPLSQYLVWAEHARRLYTPDMLVVSVVSNDFDESLRDLKLANDPGSSRGFHYFVERDEQLELALVENRPSFGRRLARSSALIRYFYMNAGLRPDATLLSRLGLVRGADEPGDNRPMTARERHLRHLFPVQEFEVLAERERASRRAVDRFLAELPTRAGLAPDRIVLTIDALRIAILHPDLAQRTAQSLFGRLRSYLIERARTAGFTVIDLDPPMRAFARETGLPVELADDYHWNGHGHRIVADEIGRSAAFRRLFDAEVSTPRRRPDGIDGTRLAR